MHRIFITTLLVLFATGPVFGQTETPLETLPTPNPLQRVPIEIVRPPTVPVVSSAVYGEDFRPPITGMVTLDAEAALWFVPNQRTGVGLNANNLAGTIMPGMGDTLGDEHLARHVIPGARAALGYWWTIDNPFVPGGRLPLYGVETRFLFVGQRSFTVTDDQSPILVRPFYDINDAKLATVIVAAPGLATGGMSVSATESLWGGEANYWQNVYYEWPGTSCSVEAMVGMRYLNLDESIHVGRVSQFAKAPVGFPAFAFLAGNHISEEESFGTRNRFIGGQVGLRGNLMFDHAIMTGLFQLGLGVTNEEINIQGSQVRVTPAGQTITSQGALLALPSNIGRHSRNVFTQVPELGVKIAFPINDNLTLAFNFSAMYWSRIARPADQIDRAVDITQIPSFPGAAAAVPTALGHPAVPFNQSDLWLLGAMITAEFKW
jgi:Putative beta barrel porin-7 (BBP7)